ncbi:LptE family protein [Chlorobium sp. BLA1]|uniref:LptE family protein n=1 Tax=Candidatus Chlorobium masyuteum TaxID=2716876 RepID=UPI0014248668|nr:LptE family protein [Candidatus Chlorobium masyuteum]NHQ60074.1 LptE family protein [Candidatus Chlorobium masyuteum]
MLKRGTPVIVLFLVMVTLQGCYSFTGGSLAPNMKTIAVPVFDDRSGAGIAQFRGELSRALADRLEAQSSFQVIPSIAGADALLDGVITSFSDYPGQLSSRTERAITNRLVLTVQVSMSNRIDKKTLFNQSFTGFADYPVGNYVAREEAIRFCLGQIVDGIFDRVVSGW